jgi:hypothetical protein
MKQNYYGWTLERWNSLTDSDRAAVIAIYRRERMYKEFKAWYLNAIKGA